MIHILGFVGLVLNISHVHIPYYIFKKKNSNILQT